MENFQRKPAGAKLSDRKSEELNKSPAMASSQAKDSERQEKTCKYSTSQGWPGKSVNIRAGGFPGSNAN